MQTYEEVMRELRDMRQDYDTGFNTEERARIEQLYLAILRKHITNTSCTNCYQDAFIEVFTFLQRNGALPEERHYELQEGKCLHIFGSSEYLFDVTDEQAEKFLAQMPDAIACFAKYPEDWKERINKRKARENYRKAAVARRKKAAAEKDDTTE